jgi:hypothetical protein
MTLSGRNSCEGASEAEKIETTSAAEHIRREIDMIYSKGTK